MSFQGEFINLVDPKGRASIPAKFREVLEQAYGDEHLVVTKNTEHGLSAYPKSHWDKIVATVEKRPASPEKAAALRLIIAPAQTCPFDKQGRIQIPQALRAHAGLEKEIVVVGMFDKIEIYSQNRYDEVTRNSEALLQANPQAVADMGF